MASKVQTAHSFRSGENEPEPLLPFPAVQALKESKLGPEIWVLGVQLRKRGVQVYRVRSHVEFRRPHHTSIICTSVGFKVHALRLLREVLEPGETIEAIKAEMQDQLARLPSLKIRDNRR